MRLLLHACCGPCLIEPLDALRDGYDVAVHYANPNIHPEPEYARRRDTLVEYAVDRRIPVSEDPYDPDAWEEAVADLEDAGPERCAECYRLRLGMTARAAAQRGFDAIATTLTVSPYQDPAAIAGAGRAAAAEAGVVYVDTDFRERYRSAVERSRDAGMYRQRYCGCRLSEAEAAEARSRRAR